MLHPLRQLSAAALLTLGLGATALAAPVTYEIEPSHSFVRFSYTHLGVSTQLSRFNDVTGDITLDTEAKSGSVNITVDTRSVDTGHEAFNQHIQGEGFLDTERYPTATFKSSRVVFDGDRPVAVEGELTIKDVTQPVTFQLTGFGSREHPMAKRPMLGADAQAVIKRSAFHADKFAGAASDDVTITVGLEALQKQ